MSINFCAWHVKKMGSVYQFLRVGMSAHASIPLNLNGGNHCAPRRTMPTARIKVGNREVTLGAYDESLVAIAQEAARRKKAELSAGARGMACNDEVIRALRAAAEEAVRAAKLATIPAYSSSILR